MSSLEQILDRCLEQVHRGEATVEACLAAHPDEAQTLRPLLMAADRLTQQGQAVTPDPRRKARTRAQLIAYANAHPPPGAKTQQKGWFFGRPRFRPIRQLAYSLTLLLLIFAVSGTMLAQAAKPDHLLYDWRTASEDLLHTVYATAAIDTGIAERRADDLIWVKDDLDLRSSVLGGYRQALDWLLAYRETPSKDFVVESLARQKIKLTNNDVEVPKELDQMIEAFNGGTAEVGLSASADKELEGRRITYRALFTNTSAMPLTITVINRLSPPEAFADINHANCEETTSGTLTCLVSGLIPEQPRDVTVTADIQPCFAGTITQTTTVTDVVGADSATADELIAFHSILTETIAPSPPPAPTIVYVQSNGLTHDLNLLSGTESLHRHAAAPAWSPDGGTLAFFGEPGVSDLGGIYAQGNGVWLMDVVNGQGQNPRQLLAQDHIRNIAWSPNGAMLAVEVADPGLPNNEIAIVEVSTGQLLNRFSGEHPAWRQDSQKLIVKGCNPACGLWQVDRGGTWESQLTFDDSDSFPSVSQTGQYLAFSSQRDGDWEIYRLRLADGQLRRLTSRPGTDTTPLFVGGCDQAIYWRADEAGTWQLKASALDGSQVRIIQEGIGQSDDWGLARPAIR